MLLLVLLQVLNKNKMFGHKKDTIQTAPLNVKVQSMPKEFYGGANPIVVFHDVKKDVTLRQQSPLSKAEKIAFNQTSVVGQHTPLHVANLLMSKKFVIWGGVSLFLLFAAGASGYYWYQDRQFVSNQITASPSPITEVVTEVPVTNVVEEVPNITSEIVSSTIPIVNNLLDYPALSLSDSVDMDNDGLSDTAEELFQTDPALPDSDGDSYSDEHEIFYLYNPSGKEPMKLIDAGTVKEYDNPVFNYGFYYPINWAVGNTKEDYKDILFSTLGGDNIEILTVEKDANQDFSTWFLQNVPTEQLSDYIAFESRFGAIGLERTDKMVYFIITPERIYILAYHTPETKIVSYKIVLKMMARSFKLPSASDNMIPLEMLEQTPVATTTDIVNVVDVPTSTP